MEKMKVRIKTPDGKPLFYESEGACGFDFKCTEDLVFEPWDFKIVELGTVVEIPKWYAMFLMPRSSTFKKHGLIQVNGAGLIDNDYCGDNDTLKVPMYNLSKDVQKIDKGTRMAQWVFIKIGTADFEVVESMNNGDRWGFWSTWVK